MQSVFKFPLAMAVLDRVDKGKLKLDQRVRFLASDRMPGSHSPLQDLHPAGEVDVSLRDLLRYSVSESDNVATDILVRLIGGPDAIQAYLRSLGIKGIEVMDNEHGLGADEQAQYRNYAEPRAMVQLLRLFADASPLSPTSTAFLNDSMEHGSSTPHRIRALLPSGTPVAHKSGTAGTRSGLTPATNDVGLITLPDGRRLALAVFLTDSRADEATRESVIARTARVVYDSAVQSNP